jgi:hypothetical protein
MRDEIRAVENLLSRLTAEAVGAAATVSVE